MNIIDRYVAKTFLSGYLILLLVGIGLYILSDMLVNIDEFTEDPTLSLAQVLQRMVDYYGYNIPLYFSQLGAFVMAIAAAFTLGMMLRNNEMTALVAAGMPLQRLAVPILICSVLLVGVSVANQELVIPRVAHKIARQHDDIVGTRTVGVYCARDDSRAIMTALRLYPREGTLERVFIIEPDEAGQPATLVEADQATYDPERETWRLVKGRRLIMGNTAATDGLGGAVQYEGVQEYPFTLKPGDLVLRQGAQWADMLSLRQMNALVQSHTLPNLATVIKSRHIRLTQPLLQWLLLALAVPFFLTREPGNVLAAGGRALLVSGAFLGVTFVSHGIIGDERAALLAWLPILLFGPVAVLQLANVKT
ncbi:MAG: LptF/LptG family permease [Planctomycetes bacterium]|nr:LptF/LptG family permease [Planctomycetota bacterium]